MDFKDTVQNAKSYEWDFDGDGVTDLIGTAPTASHVYNAIGTYKVRLIAVDSNSCNVRDTAYTLVRARDDQATLGFNYAKIGACESLEFQFTIPCCTRSKTVQSQSFTGFWRHTQGGHEPAINHTFPVLVNIMQLILPDMNIAMRLIR